MKEYMSCNDVATRYGVKKNTVWDWIRKKKLPAYKIGRQYRITESQLEKFEENNMTTK